MKMVPTLCTQCGAAVEVDLHKDTAVCDVCNTPFILEGARDFTSYASLTHKAETYLTLQHYDNAGKFFKEITETYPNKYRGWWGLAETITQGFTIFDKLEHGAQLNYERAKKLADDARKAEITAIFEDYISRQRAFDLKRDQENAARAVVDGEKRAINDQIIAIAQQRDKKSLAMQRARHKKYPWRGMFIFIAIIAVTSVFFLDIALFTLIDIFGANSFARDILSMGQGIEMDLFSAAILGFITWLGLGILFSIIKMIIWCCRKISIKRKNGRIYRLRAKIDGMS